MRATHNQRQVVVRLTEKGHALGQEGVQVPDCMFDLLGLDMETLGRIRRHLAMLRERLAGEGG